MIKYMLSGMLLLLRFVFSLIMVSYKLLLSVLILVFPQLWDTDILCTEYAWNYWLKSQTSVRWLMLRLLTWFPVDSSPRRLSVDQRWNYWLESQPTRFPDVCLLTNTETIWIESQSYVIWPTQKLLTHIPVVCPSTVTTTNESRPRHLSFDRYRN